MEKIDQNLQKLGKFWRSIWEKSILQFLIINSAVVNFNYQVFSVSDLPIPAGISTPTFDSELGVEVDTATVRVIPEVPEH